MQQENIKIMETMIWILCGSYRNRKTGKQMKHSLSLSHISLNIFDTPIEQKTIFNNLDIELGITDDNDYLHSTLIRTPTGGTTWNWSLWKKNCLDVMDGLVRLGERTEQQREEYKQLIDRTIQGEMETNCELYFHLNIKEQGQQSDGLDFSTSELPNKLPRGLDRTDDTFAIPSLSFQG